MIKIHENTIEQIRSMIETSSQDSIRVLAKKGCWSGIEWDIVLDEQKNDDIVFEDKGVKILVEARLVKLFSNATIEYKNTFFGKKFIIK